MRLEQGPDPDLVIRGLRKRYGPIQVLDGFDLTVGAGELVALVGENGVGKSTVVRCVARAVDPDAGDILVGGSPLGVDPVEVQAQGVSVVWQDLALCDNLDVVANLFLGRERGQVLLADAEMHGIASLAIDRLDLDLQDLHRPVGLLSGGQRQLVAIARALLWQPRLLVLDEPTANLSATAARTVEDVIRGLRANGTTVLLVTHRIDQVFELADRIAVLRDGRVITEVSPLEVHPDDLVALMSGVEVDSTARRQLRRLHSLVDQLAEVAPSASLPLITSAVSAALSQDQLCVHLLDHTEEGPVLRRSAAVGLADELLAVNAVLPVGEHGGSVGAAVARGEPVVVEDVRVDPLWRDFREAAQRAGVLSAWAAPIVGSAGVLGSLSGYADTVGRLEADQLELVSLYAGYAASAIERERLLEDATRRNRILETLRGVLEALAGPDHVSGGLEVALLALGRGLEAQAVAIHTRTERGVQRRAAIALVSDGSAPDLLDQLDAAADAALQGADLPADDLVVAQLELPEGPGVLSAIWPGHGDGDALELLADAARSVRLAVERDALANARHEAVALRRSHEVQRAFLTRLSHELRTPLTAIHGYASTLRQPDVTWDAASQARFLDSIAAESSRLGRLVGDLLDSSAIESGVLQLNRDWCDLPLILDAALACVPDSPPTTVTLVCHPDLPPVWADHDRVEQVVVNLVDNAVRHTPAGSRIVVEARPGAGGTVEVRVVDDGPGVPAGLAAKMFRPHVRGASRSGGAGLGLAIALGIAEAHGGSIALEPSARGACFLFVLPVDPPPGDDAETGWLVEGAAQEVPLR